MQPKVGCTGSAGCRATHAEGAQRKCRDAWWESTSLGCLWFSFSWFPGRLRNCLQGGHDCDSLTLNTSTHPKGKYASRMQIGSAGSSVSQQPRCIKRQQAAQVCAARGTDASSSNHADKAHAYLALAILVMSWHRATQLKTEILNGCTQREDKQCSELPVA
eukprot:1152764-Pelagomonas_calceolata.AAC.2